ncbi:MAG: hypothetical protein ABW110_12525 [Steroidobacteraceae bacterium]
MSEDQRDLEHRRAMQALQAEMTLVKHPYQAGYRAQRGIEF